MGTKHSYHTASFINDGKVEDEFEQIESLYYDDEGDYGDAEVLDEYSDESGREHIPGQSDTPPVTATTISANRPPKPFRPQIPQDAERMFINEERERERQRERDRRQVPPPAQPAAVIFTPYTPPKPIKPPRSPPATSRIPGARSSTPPLPVPAPPPLHSMGDTHSSKRHQAIAATSSAAVSPEWRSGRYSSSPPDPPLLSSPPYPPRPSHTNRIMTVSTAAAPSPSHTNRTMSVSTAAAPSPSHTNRTMSVSTAAAPSPSHTNRIMTVSTAAAPSPSHTNRTMSVSTAAAPSPSHTNRIMSVSTAAAPSPSHTNRIMSVSTTAAPASIISSGEAPVPGPPSDCSEADSEDYQNSTLGTDDVSTCPDLELEFQDEHFFPRHPYGA
jgi:hypothetical protein